MTNIKAIDWILLAVTGILSVLFVVFQNTGSLLPLSMVDFVFIVFLLFAFALYRPSWAFLMFVGWLPLETIDLAPIGVGLHVRPYQLLGGVLLVALLVRLVSRRLKVRLMRWHWIDACIVMMLVGGAVATVFSPRVALSAKQLVVLASFGALYLLTRYFVRSAADALRVVPFVAMSSVVAGGYALWQNMRFAQGLENFAVMSGRPNATLAEPDWLGMFLIPAIGIGMVWFHSVWVRLWRQNGEGTLGAVWRSVLARHVSWSVIAELCAAWVYVVFLTVVLTMTVARSAWLGGATLALIVFLSYIWRRGVSLARWPWAMTMIEGMKMFAAMVIGMFVVVGFHLTTFPIFERAQSVAGWQTITVACQDAGIAATLPERVGSLNELATYGCWHIDLEDREKETMAGMTVTTTMRPDPNTNIRASIYAQTMHIVERSWLTGIGWGSAGAFLGSDERGADLNASNAFLEVWLGSGLVGMLAFVLAWGWILWAATARVVCTRDPFDAETRWAQFMLASGVGMTVFNLFNSGILLGFVWVWMALGAALVVRIRRKSEELVQEER